MQSLSSDRARQNSSSLEYVDEGGGFDEALLCSVCSQPLVDPLMHRDCGNLACGACIRRSQFCPICLAPTKDALQDVPRLIKNRINSLLVYCPLCYIEKVPRANLDAHVSRCRASSSSSVASSSSSSLAAPPGEQSFRTYGLFSQSPAFVLGGGEDVTSPPSPLQRQQPNKKQQHARGDADESLARMQNTTRSPSTLASMAAAVAASEAKEMNLEGELLARLGVAVALGEQGDGRIKRLAAGRSRSKNGTQDDAEHYDDDDDYDDDEEGDSVVVDAHTLKQMEKKFLDTAMNALAKILTEKQGKKAVAASASNNSLSSGTTTTTRVVDVHYMDSIAVQQLVHSLPLCSAKRLAEPRSLWDELWARVRDSELTASAPQRQLRVLAVYFALPEHLQTVRNWWKSYAAVHSLPFETATLANIEQLRDEFLAAVAKHRLPTRDLFKRLLNYRYHLQDNFVEFHGNWTRQLSEIELRLGFPSRGFARLGHLLFARAMSEDSRVVEILMGSLPDLEFINPWDEVTIQLITTAITVLKHARATNGIKPAAAASAMAKKADDATTTTTTTTTVAAVMPAVDEGKERRYCFKCKQPGHLLKHCPENNNNSGGGQASAGGVGAPPATMTTTTTTTTTVEKDKTAYEKCYRCGERGHKRKDCKNKPGPSDVMSKEKDEGEKKEEKTKEKAKEKSKEKMDEKKDEEKKEETKKKKKKNKDGKASAKLADSSMPAAVESANDAPPPTKHKCFRCGEYGHLQKSCTSAEAVERLKTQTCYRCGEKGHMARDCAIEAPEVDRSSYKCFKCGKLGHLHRHCPNETNETNEKPPSPRGDA